MSNYTLSAEITADTSDFEAGIDEAKDSLGELGDKCEGVGEEAGSSGGLLSKLREKIRGVGSSSRESGTHTSKFGGAMKALGSVGMGVGMQLGQRVFSAIADLSGEMIEASDSADKFASTLSFAGIDDSAIRQLTASTQEYADKTVYGLSDVRNITAQLAANGVADYDKLAQAAGNLNAVAGGNAETFKSVGMVMTQTAGAGKLTTENWNQLADAIPGASGKLQEAMKANGAYTGDFREAMANGEITAEEFNKAIMDLGFTDAAVDAATSTSTIEGAMGNLAASVVGVGSQVIGAVKPLVTGAMTEVANFISGIPGMLVGIGQALSPIIGPIVSQVQSQLMPALATLGGSLSNLAGAVMPVFQAAFNAATPVLGSFIGNVIDVVTAIADTLAPAIDGIAQIINAVLPVAQAAFEAACSAIQGVIDAVFPAIEAVVSNVMNVINAVIGTVLALIKGDWEGVWNGIKAIGQTVWDAIGNIIEAGINAAKGVIDSVLSAIKGIWDGAWNGLKSLVGDIWEGIKTGVSNGIDAVMDFIGEVPGKITGFFSGCGTWLVDSGKALLQGFADGVMGAVGWVGDKISGALSDIRALFPFSPAKRGPFSGHGYTTYSGRALMTDFAESIVGTAPIAARAADSALGQVGAVFSAAPATVAAAVADGTGREAGGAEGAELVIGWLSQNLPGIIAECTPVEGQRDFERRVRAVAYAV